MLILPNIVYADDKCKITVFKEQRILILNSQKYNNFFWIRLGKNPVGKKIEEGDKKTPEGQYQILFKNKNSKYFMSLKTSYPNKEDLKNAKNRHIKPGTDIFIHGQMKEAKWTYKTDWTNGCIALSNFDMQELYKHVDVGCKIIIKK